METTKEIKDYLHLYLGCEVMFGHDRRYLKGAESNIAYIGYPDLEPNRAVSIKDVIIILRPLSDITEEEKDNYNPMGDRIHPVEFLYLLSKHFDLFGLIEAGLAIDASKLKKMEV